MILKLWGIVFKMKNSNELAGKILRISLSLVFFWFGTNQILHPTNWTSLIPSFINNLGISSNLMVTLNGTMELALGALLILGLYTKFASLLLGLHLLGIASIFGLNSPTGVRDFGLALATLSIFFIDSDSWSFDYWFSKKEMIKSHEDF